MAMKRWIKALPVALPVLAGVVGSIFVPARRAVSRASIDPLGMWPDRASGARPSSSAGVKNRTSGM